MIEATGGLIDYWHDLYVREMCTRHQILETLKLPVTTDEKLSEVERIANWRPRG